MNTVEALDHLEQVAFTTEQAKAIVRIVADSQNLLAKKEDIERLEAKIAQIEDKMVTKDEMRAEIIKAKYDLVKWIIGGIIANGAVVATLIKLLL